MVMYVGRHMLRNVSPAKHADFHGRTMLVTVLANSFMSVASRANEEYQ